MLQAAVIHYRQSARYLRNRFVIAPESFGSEVAGWLHLCYFIKNNQWFGLLILTCYRLPLLCKQGYPRYEIYGNSEHWDVPL